MTQAWDAETNTYQSEKYRQADVYVFALLAHKDKPTINPLDVSQWKLYVMPTFELDKRERSQHSITLNSLRALAGESLTYSDILPAVMEAARVQQRHKENG